MAEARAGRLRTRATCRCPRRIGRPGDPTRRGVPRARPWCTCVDGRPDSRCAGGSAHGCEHAIRGHGRTSTIRCGSSGASPIQEKACRCIQDATRAPPRDGHARGNVPRRHSCRSSTGIPIGERSGSRSKRAIDDPRIARSATTPDAQTRRRRRRGSRRRSWPGATPRRCSGPSPQANRRHRHATSGKTDTVHPHSNDRAAKHTIRGCRRSGISTRPGVPIRRRRARASGLRSGSDAIALRDPGEDSPGCW